MINLILLGAPGAGKGTQAKEICGSFGFVHISTGDLLRQQKEKDTPLAETIKGYMNSGALVPDEVVIEVLKEAVERNKDKKGLIFDGFPRTVNQAEKLDTMLSVMGLTVDKVVFFDVTREVSVQRLCGRLVCSQCGFNFHKTNMPPKSDGVCDKCGGSLYQRDDDKEEVIQKRWEAYFEHTQPLIDYYKKQDKLIEMDANVDKEKTLASLEDLIHTLET